jgi:hypothetical protein
MITTHWFIKNYESILKYFKAGLFLPNNLCFATLKQVNDLEKDCYTYMHKGVEFYAWNKMMDMKLKPLYEHCLECIKEFKEGINGL